MRRAWLLLVVLAAAGCKGGGGGGPTGGFVRGVGVAPGEASDRDDRPPRWVDHLNK